MAEAFRALQLRQYNSNFLSQNKRSDGRSFLEYRLSDVKSNAVPTSDGSCVVKYGNTTVICGLKGTILDIPSEQESKEGAIEITVSLPINMSQEMKWSRDALKDQEDVCASKLSDWISQSDCLPLDQLKISDDNAWNILLEIIVLDYDGNLMDASFAAAIGALNSACLPSVKSDESQPGMFVFSDKRDQKLKLKSFPFSTTFGIIQDTNSRGEMFILADPTVEEETLSSGTITIVTDALTKQMVNILKEGGVPLNSDRLIECTTHAITRSQEMYKKLQ